MNVDSLLTIQRMLGTIEGAVLGIEDTGVIDTILNAVQGIDEAVREGVLKGG
jgi:hypothetical protein